jgi:cleavage and polyadenylation specificity factor subunit 2
MYFSRGADDSSDESESEIDNAVARGKHDILVKPEVKSQSGFFKTNKKQFPMFPFFEEKVKFDEYGEIIK